MLRAREYDPRLNTYALLINPSDGTPSVGGFHIYQIDGGNLAKNKRSRMPYEIILRQPEASTPEGRKIIVFGNTLAGLFPEEALDRNDAEQPCLSPDRAKAELATAVKDAIFLLGTASGGGAAELKSMACPAAHADAASVANSCRLDPSPQ